MGKAAIAGAASLAGGLASGIGSAIGGKGGGAGATQTQQSNTSLPGWVNTGAQDIWGRATNNYFTTPGPYEGQRVADLTPETRSLIESLYGRVGATDQAFNTAQGWVNSLSGFTPSTIDPQTLRNTDLSAYMNPFTQNVIDPSMKLLEQQRQQSLNQIGSQATQNKAFGGSRQGVQEGVTNAQSALQGGQLGAQLWGQNFNQAQAAAAGDIQRNLEAQKANQAAGEWGAQFKSGLANQLAQLSSNQQQNWLTGAQAALQGQGMLTSYNQALLDAQRQAYAEKQGWEDQRLKTYASYLQGLPYGQTVTQTSPTGTSESPLMSGLGTAGTLAGIFGKAGMFGGGSGSGFGTGFDYNSVARTGMDALGALPGFIPSDRRLKTDIKKLGTDPETDLDVYAYRYKGDSKSYPKVVGVMAQDVEKKYPELVKEVGGYKAIPNWLAGGFGHG